MGLNYDDLDAAMKARDDMRRAVMSTIKIDFDQVLQIVVTDLINKYNYLVKANDSNQEVFKQVLLYYLEPYELDKYCANPELIYKECEEDNG